MGSFTPVNQQESKQKRSHTTMRGFIILGALSAVTRGAELPVTDDDNLRGGKYKYVSTQSDPVTNHGDVTAWTGTCSNGNKQSPINIVTSSAKEESTDPGEIMLAGHDNTMTGKVLNDGRQIYFKPNAGPYPTIYGGPLTSTKTYIFDHLEFKFGTDATKGSEHKLDGKQYPMEIQLVFWDHSTHATATVAGGHANADSVVVLSYFVETDTTANTALASIIEAVDDPSALVPDDSTLSSGGGLADSEAGRTLKLKDLLGDMNTVKDYYYYAGSQTSSTCKQNVKWIIATDMLKISTTQLAYFPLLHDAQNNNGGITGSFVAPNFRDVSDDSIDVMHRSSKTKKSERFGEAATILGSTLLGIGTFGTVLNLLQHDTTAKALKSNPILQLIEDFDKKFLNGEEEQQSHQQFQQQQFQQRY